MTHYGVYSKGLRIETWTYDSFLKKWVLTWQRRKYKDGYRPTRKKSDFVSKKSV